MAVSLWINCSAVGDAVCTVPTVKALLAENKLYKLLVPKRFTDIFKICGIDENLIIEATPEFVKKKFDGKGSDVLMVNIKGHAAYRIHLIDLFSIFPLNAVLKPEEKNIKALPEKLPVVDIGTLNPYVVIGVGYAQKSRKLPVKAYNEIVKFCKKKGFEIVLLGSSRLPTSEHPIHFEEHPREGCIDLIDKTTIAGSVAVMNTAACVIGMDSGLIYLAAMTETPIVCGYTFVDPYYRMPFRRNEMGWKFYPVEPTGDCKYCSNDLAMFGVPFDSHCPKGKDFSCASSLTGKDFITAIKKSLK